MVDGYDTIEEKDLKQVYDCIKETESKRGGEPVYKLEVYQTWYNHGYGPNNTQGKGMVILHHILTNLYKQDRVMADREFGMLSTDPKY